jgi:peptide/nickel transport system permease protein
MRHALRRILWIGPMLFVMSLLSFWVQSRGEGAPLAQSGGSVAREALGRFPRFLNRQPTSVRTLATQAMDSVARGDARAPASAIELCRLGGAALPHVLPRLDSLSPTERARVAQSLAPLARRMQLGDDAALRDPAAAVLFWHRFWEDRSIDFRPVVVKRAVQRVAREATLVRQADILELDTYALPDLVEALGTVQGPDDVDRVRRITGLLAHVTGQDWRIGEHATAAVAAAAIARWNHWWLLNGADYQVLEGPHRLRAMVVETAYGKWLSEAATPELGTTVSGQTVRSLARERLPVTLWLVAVALLGGAGLGLVWGLLAAVRPETILDRATSVVTLLLLALPVIVVARLLVPAEAAHGSPVAAAVILLLVTAALMARHQRSAARAEIESPHHVTRRAFGASAWQSAVLELRGSSTVVISWLGAGLPTVLAAALVVEHALGLPGLGPATVAAAAQHDVAWLQAMALGSVVLTCLGQAASDLLLVALGPGIHAPLERQEERDE